MKKTSLIFCFLFLMISYMPSVFSYSGIYYGMFTGTNVFQSKHQLKSHYHVDGKSKIGSVFGTVVGLDLQLLALEGEYSYQKSRLNSDHHKGSARARYYMFNGLVNSPWSFIFTPYIGLGVGYKQLRISGHYLSHFYSNASASSESSQSKHALNSRTAAWQAIAGVKCPLFCSMELAIEIRYKDTFKKSYASNYHSGIFLKYFF
jgi:opacity protein-like surface antigen